MYRQGSDKGQRMTQEEYDAKRSYDALAGQAMTPMPSAAARTPGSRGSFNQGIDLSMMPGYEGPQPEAEKKAPQLTPQDIIQQAFTLGGQSRYHVPKDQALQWIETRIPGVPFDQQVVWRQARDILRKS